MKKSVQLWAFLLALIPLVFSCDPPSTDEETEQEKTEAYQATEGAAKRYNIYVPFELTTDISVLTEAEKKMLPLMIEAAKVMDDLFWKQAYGGREAFLSQIEDPALKKFAEINYGPYDRLDNNTPFIQGIAAKPKGAQFYPADATKEDIVAGGFNTKADQYTLIRKKGDKLTSVPYTVEYREELEKAAGFIRQAAELAEDVPFKNYLVARADALLSNDYDASDIAWLDSKSSRLDLIIGPIESYEDELLDKRTSYEAYVVVRDLEWGKKLEKYVPLLPQLQKTMPVDQVYKAESPGSDSHLVAGDVVFYAGHSNAGSKTIAVNLPNDEKIQQQKGTRRTQIKNAMQAKFDKILVPIADQLIDQDQIKHITFSAFFANTMFHEVAHGLGIKNTITGKGTVKDALQEEASALEEGKADILGLYMVTKLFEMGEYNEGELMDNYVTFMASIFRSVRFGASSAHGKANMLRFNYFLEKEAFAKNPETGRYKVDFANMQIAMNDLTALILQIQGDGDYEGVKKLMAEKGIIMPELQSDLDKLTEMGIPVDVVFQQGREVLGL